METESKKRTSPGKIFVISILSVILAILIYFSVMSMLGPVRKMEAFRNEFVSKPAGKNPSMSSIQGDSLYLSLFKEKAFLQSRIAMAQTDSIYLTLDMADSTANLEISGVTVHKVKIHELSMSKILRKGDENVLFSLFSNPFNIENSFSTIPREPLMIKTAPKDTSEYQPSVMPDTSVTEPVNYVLELSNGTRLFVYQAEIDKSGNRSTVFKFDLRYRLQDLTAAIKSVAHFKVPDYHPFIKMKLPRADAKIIYRALPKNGQIAIIW